MVDLLTADQFQALQKSRRPNATPEHDLQCEVVFDFDRLYPQYEGLLFAIPNGAKLPYKKDKKGRRICPEAIKLKKEGLRPGVPDLQLPVPKGLYHGLFIEMKFGDNKPSPEQKVFMNRLIDLGYCCKVCYSRDEAREIFKTYLNA